jgi:hypothetical protein
MFALDARQVAKHEGLTTDYESPALTAELQARRALTGEHPTSNLQCSMSESCAVLQAISECHSERSEESRINLAPILQNRIDQRCLPWASRHSHGELKMTGGSSVAAALQRKATAIVNVARIIATVHIISSLPCGAQKKATSCRCEALASYTW